ncbi:DUF4982 domain-containing protein [Flammeovirga yaeyamensis]|uniref:DUF4982 domain-containing protein n=1 Tax=Flammeovirga yaeyamensis TaxID=367791 RepID=A0AAX1NF46_9BACT|nr:glycoside hydrolase family 2 TIM barrel-domain containing protein [Flammeovirga yaeyamensis]MBB3696611.1 beta-galactosidase [Flammeovirga yaeyamensis]QWG05435.1 DUF4982 domain-containing protein [Flammeovirga yaeyamensis]
MKTLFMRIFKINFIIQFIFMLTLQQTFAADKVNFNDNWKFQREISPVSINETEVLKANFDDSKWESVKLPHTTNIEPLPVNDQWQGIAWYRKQFQLDKKLTDKKIIIELEAAMNYSQVWVNGQLIKEHQGGYLPVVFDITSVAKFDAPNTIVVRLDNTDNEVTGPKPLKRLDFNMYGGLYRNAWLISKNKVHITHPILENKVAGGGIFVTYPEASKEKAVVNIKTHIRNANNRSSDVKVVHELVRNNKVIKKSKASKLTLSKGQDQTNEVNLEIKKPLLWSVDAPNLYKLVTKIYYKNQLVDQEETTIGIRRMEFKGTKFYMNGEEQFMRGVNRHQEYPYVGYALSDNAQVRDAIKIKNAGFDFVRLSHYPHSPSFMHACDSLGLVVLDAILGWQYYNETEAFRNQMFNASRDLVRRDRNHACVTAWEVSLNETKNMPLEFREKLSAIAHEEYPGDQCFTAGWMAEGWDIFLQARQHKIMHKDTGITEKPYAVSEYGDWEYYSNNAGLNQDKMPKSERYETSSRQARAFGEARLLNQAYNVQEAFNDNKTTSAFADSYWVMYDYTRGYHKDLELSGLMDIYRIPKFAYYFYQSQRPVSEQYPAMVKLATYWQEDSPLDIKVYSNCEEVALYLNDQLIETKKPTKDKISEHLEFPPITFNLKQFTSGTLKAVGKINGKVVIEDIVRTPGKAVKIEVALDKSGVEVSENQNDIVFVYLKVVDANGTVVEKFNEKMDVQLTGDIELMNNQEIKAEAGIGTAVIRVNSLDKNIDIKATSKNGLEGTLQLLK